MLRTFAASAALAGLLVGCEYEEVTDAGTIVVDGGDAAALSVEVFSPDCLSGSCDVDREGSCSLVRQGDRIVIESEFSWTHKTVTSGCTADCGTISVTCTLNEALEDGSFTLVLGENEGPLTVSGGQVQKTCIEDPNGSGVCSFQ